MWATSAHAVGFDTEGGNLTLGISGAYTLEQDETEGSMVGYEITGTIRLLGIHWWASQGFRYRFTHAVDGYWYYEGGVWALLNLGAGVAFGGGHANPVHLQLFAGLPIPILGMGDDNIFPGFFIELYYRPMLSFGERIEHLTGVPNDLVSEHWTHEIGVMLKLTSLKFAWPWEKEPSPELNQLRVH